MKLQSTRFDFAQISDAPSVLRPETQKIIADALTKGSAVTVQAPTASEAPQLRSSLASSDIDTLLAVFKSPLGETPVLTVHPSAQQALGAYSSLTPEQRMAAGVGTGTMVGAGAGLLIEIARNIEPTGAVSAITTIACALIGAGLGGALGAGLIGEVQWDASSNTVTIKGATNPA